MTGPGDQKGVKRKGKRESLRASPLQSQRPPPLRHKYRRTLLTCLYLYTTTQLLIRRGPRADTTHSSRVAPLFLNYSLSLVSLSSFLLFVSISFDVERIKVENHQSERFGWKSWLVDSGKWKQSTTVAHNKGLRAILDQVLLVRVKNAKHGQTHRIL